MRGARSRSDVAGLVSLCQVVADLVVCLVGKAGVAAVGCALVRAIHLGAELALGFEGDDTKEPQEVDVLESSGGGLLDVGHRQLQVVVAA